MKTKELTEAQKKMLSLPKHMWIRNGTGKKKCITCGIEFKTSGGKWAYFKNGELIENPGCIKLD